MLLDAVPASTKWCEMSFRIQFCSVFDMCLMKAAQHATQMELNTWANLIRNTFAPALKMYRHETQDR